MLGGGLNYLGSCSKGRSMLRQLHIAQSLFGESNDLGVFREEMEDGFEQGTTPIPRIAHILVFEKTMLCKNCISGIVLMIQLMWNSPTCAYIGRIMPRLGVLL